MEDLIKHFQDDYDLDNSHDDFDSTIKHFNDQKRRK